MLARASSEAGIKVAFDHQIFAIQRHGGISRYFSRLLDFLPGQQVTARALAPLHVNSYIDAETPRRVWGRRLPDGRIARRIARDVDGVLQRPLTYLFTPDIVHETYYASKRTAPRRCRVALTVYDMIHELFPDLFPNDDTVVRKADAIGRADHIFCISQNTRDDLIRFFPEAADRTSVTLLGFDNAPDLPNTSTRAMTRPYILFVGGRHGYKNFSALLEAYAGSPALRGGFDLLCIGGGPLLPPETEAIGKAGLQASVRHETVDDATLHRRYRDAALFVYPSLYEGFGIPPLEAMSADCPVVAMNASSIPEVCGDAAEYAVPGDPTSLLKAMENVIGDERRANELRAAGRARLACFSWQRCAEQTARCYRALARDH